MKHKRFVFALAALLAGVFVSEAALADRGRFGHRGRTSVSIGINVGVPVQRSFHQRSFHQRSFHRPFPVFVPVISSAFYYPAPVYYYPPTVIVPAPRPVYIERQDDLAASAPNQNQSYWYYCNAAGGYYPYVKECPSGWQKVLPTPPSAPG